MCRTATWQLARQGGRAATWEGYLDVISDKVDRIEADTKLADQVDVVALLHLLQEGCMGKARCMLTRSCLPGCAKAPSDGCRMIVKKCLGAAEGCEAGREKLHCNCPPEVPDLAMVPRFLTRSSRVMPTPVSRSVSTFLSWSTCAQETSACEQLTLQQLLAGVGAEP